MGDNADQAAFWGGDAGQKWVMHQALLDAQMLPVLQGVLRRADLAAGHHVLDVGCGTGQSTLMAADLVGHEGHVQGADISAAMLALAEARTKDAPQASCACVDVATHPFEDAGFDRVISRFGVMFFDDPVAAFANIRRAMKPGALICFASWGQIERNPWFTLPARIAKEVIGTPPKSDPDGPGPFAFRDITKVAGILRAAGLREVQGHAEDMHFTLPGGARDMARLTSHIGPAEGTQRYFNSDAATRQRLLDRLEEGFAAFPDHAVPAEINFFTARCK